MTNGYIPHAIQRAMERYGLKLTHGDLVDLCRACMIGNGRLSFLPDGKERHIANLHGKVVVVVYAPYDGPYGNKPKEGKVVTILPREAALKGAKSSFATKPNGFRMRPKKKVPKKSRQRNPLYSQ